MANQDSEVFSLIVTANEREDGEFEARTSCVRLDETSTALDAMMPHVLLRVASRERYETLQVQELLNAYPQHASSRKALMGKVRQAMRAAFSISEGK